jgi:dihydroflavonol-4-reductase
MILDYCLGKRHEYLDAELNLIDVRDVAEGMIRAMEQGQPGRRYLLGHENLSIQAVFGLLADLTGLSRPRWRVPYSVALAAAYLSELLADVCTHQRPAATITGVKLTRRRMHFDPRRSLNALELQPRPVAQSLADALAWYKQMGWLGFPDLPGQRIIPPKRR